MRSDKKLIELAEKKMGKGTTISLQNGEWVAERTTERGRKQVAGRDRDTLKWVLEQLPDLVTT